jgi:hypothetical protein
MLSVSIYPDCPSLKKCFLLFLISFKAFGLSLRGQGAYKKSDDKYGKVQI